MRRPRRAKEDLMRVTIAALALTMFVAGCSSSDAPRSEGQPRPPERQEKSQPPPRSPAAARGSSQATEPPHGAHDHAIATAPSGGPPLEPPGAPLKGTAVDFPGSAGKASGYLAVPAGDAKGKHPAILVIQEWWGMNDWVKRAADHFAEQGYVALAVDLYRGKSTTDPEEAHELMRGLPEDRGLADLEAGFELLSKRIDVEPTRVGAVGWCMGGGYATNLATHEKALAAVAVNYGHLVVDRAAIANMHAAFLGNFGGKDKGITPDDVHTFEKEAKAVNKDVDVKIYESDGHAFMNPSNKEGYDAASTDDAWKRIDAFFAKKLKG
ncbi:MAG TPA: dienelactone hydrolase family protein [Byssovorax sp.]